jgi:hypothetical protein
LRKIRKLKHIRMCVGTHCPENGTESVYKEYADCAILTYV